MATARKLPSGSWRCQVYSHTEKIKLPDGTTKDKRIYKSFTCDIPGPQGKRACEKMAADWAEKKENTINQQHEDITFGQAFDMYVDNRSAVLSPSTIKEYKRIRKRNLGYLENMKLETITQEQIQSFVNDFSVSHSPKTVRNTHGIISTILRTYRPSFVLNTKLPQKKKTKLYIPSDNEIQTLILYLRRTNNEMEIPVLLAAFGPMRRSEICALCYEDIEGNRIHVHRGLVYNESNGLTEKSPKNYSSDRYIDFPEEVIARIGTGTGRIVNYTPAALTLRFEHILKNAGLPHFRFHDLRHYCASILHAMNIPDVYIMGRGGWATPTTLNNVYRHSLDDVEKEMNDRANTHFSELCNTKCNTEFKKSSK